MQAITFPNTKLTESMVEHEIRVRAYEIYENRGKTEGHALEDWLQAEVDVQRRSCGVLKC
jgi:uroporphyrinogen-III synthase